MFNFSHLQSTLHLMQNTYWDVFFHCSKQFLNLLILMPFSAFAIFLNYILLITLLQLSWFFPCCPPAPRTLHSLRQSLHHCSCPWVMGISSLSAIFCFTSSTSAKCFSLRTFYIGGNKQKKVSQDEIQWIGSVGLEGASPFFCQKMLNTQHGVDCCVHKSPIMKGANVLK